MERKVVEEWKERGEKGEEEGGEGEEGDRGTSKLISIFTFPEAVNLFLYTQSRES